jgi:hypothetical protein
MALQSLEKPNFSHSLAIWQMRQSLVSGLVVTLIIVIISYSVNFIDSFAPFFYPHQTWHNLQLFLISQS